MNASSSTQGPTLLCRLRPSGVDERDSQFAMRSINPTNAYDLTAQMQPRLLRTATSIQGRQGVNGCYSRRAARSVAAARSESTFGRRIKNRRIGWFATQRVLLRDAIDSAPGGGVNESPDPARQYGQSPETRSRGVM